jgi:hypothetical protein
MPHRYADIRAERPILQQGIVCVFIPVDHIRNDSPIESWVAAPLINRHTAIIGTLLPLLFALIGGTSGIYLASADQTSPAAERLRWLGPAFAYFGVACLIGSTAGILLRLHYERPYRGNELSTLWHGRVQESLQLASLRTKLRLLGVSPDDESAILGDALGALNDTTQQIPSQHVREVSAQARQLQTELKALRDKATAAKAQVP